MAENKTNLEITVIKESNNNPNPIFSLISKFQNLFKPPPQPAVVAKQPTEKEEVDSVVVKFPRGQPEMPSLRLETDEQCSERNTNPFVLWQVYAIGGFFVVRWVLARLNERRTKKKPSDEEPSPGDD